MDGVTLIKESDHTKVHCTGVSVPPGEGGVTYLSVIARAFAQKFDLPGANTTLGQLIAQRLALPIMRIVKGGNVEYWELPEEHFDRVHSEKTGKWRVKLKVAREVAWRQVGVARWQQLLG
jgi:hypothetical protein